MGPPRGPDGPQGTGLFRRRLNGDKEKTGPRLSVGCTKVCSLSAVPVQHAWVGVVCVHGINSYWSIGRSRGGAGEGGMVGIAANHCACDGPSYADQHGDACVCVHGHGHVRIFHTIL